MRQTKSYKIVVYDLISGLNPRLSYSAENLPDSQVFGLFVCQSSFRVAFDSPVFYPFPPGRSGAAGLVREKGPNVRRGITMVWFLWFVIYKQQKSLIGVPRISDRALWYEIWIRTPDCDVSHQSDHCRVFEWPLSATNWKIEVEEKWKLSLQHCGKSI
jgi:hypothetical protein